MHYNIGHLTDIVKQKKLSENPFLIKVKL